MASAISRVSAVFKRHALVSNMVVYGCMYGSGDLSRQYLQRVSDLDYPGATRMAVIGSCCLAPVYFVWYRWLDARFPATTIATVTKKVIIDQAIASTGGVIIFFTSLSFLERRADLFQELKEKGLKTYLTGCLYWPAMQVINFRYAPPQARVVFIACAGFVWCNILSYIKSVKTSTDAIVSTTGVRSANATDVSKPT